MITILKQGHAFQSLIKEAILIVFITFSLHSMTAWDEFLSCGFLMFLTCLCLELANGTLILKVMLCGAQCGDVFKAK